MALTQDSKIKFYILSDILDVIPEKCDRWVDMRWVDMIGSLDGVDDYLPCLSIDDHYFPYSVHIYILGQQIIIIYRSNPTKPGEPDTRRVIPLADPN